MSRRRLRRSNADRAHRRRMMLAAMRLSRATRSLFSRKDPRRPSASSLRARKNPQGCESPPAACLEGALELWLLGVQEEDSAEWVEVKPQRFARARGGLYRKTTQRGQRYLRNEAEPAAHRSIDAKSREALPSKAAAEAASADASIATQQSQQGSMGCNRQDSPSTPEIPAPAVPKGSASPAIGFPAGEPASPGSRLDPRAAEFVPPHWAVMQQYGPGCDAVAGWHFPPPPYPWMYSYPMLIPPCYPIPPGPVIMPMPIHMPPPPPPFRSCPPPDHTAMGQAVAQPAPLVPVTPPPLGTAASPSPEANNAPAAMIHPQQTGVRRFVARPSTASRPSGG